MTKKQLKQLAKKIAEYEYTIQTSKDKNAVDEAKSKMVQATDAAKLSLDDMIAMDELVNDLLAEKNICS
jgi:phage shock protein A